MKPSPCARARSISPLLAILPALVLLAGCGPAAPSPDHPTSPDHADGGAAARPGRAQAESFFAGIPKNEIRFDLQTEPALPKTDEPGVWLLPIKVSATPLIPLYQEAAYNAPERDEAIRSDFQVSIAKNWQEKFAQTGFGKRHAAEFSKTAPVMPRLLVETEKPGKTYGPYYGRLRCEHQVDHWKVDSVDLDVSPAFINGRTPSAFQGPYVVLGSPEARAFFAAQREFIARVNASAATLQGEYAAMVREGTRPGISYRGYLFYTQDSSRRLDATMRFVPWPEGGPDAVGLEVSLPGAGDCRVRYQCHRLTELSVGNGLKAGLIARFAGATSSRTSSRTVDEESLAQMYLSNLTTRDGLSGSWDPTDWPLLVDLEHLSGAAALFFGLEATRVNPPAPAKP